MSVADRVSVADRLFLGLGPWLVGMLVWNEWRSSNIGIAVMIGLQVMVTAFRVSRPA